MSETKSDGAGCLAAVVLLVISPATTAWKGYVASLMWAWFVVPTFHLPILSIPAAIGLSYVVATITPAHVSNCIKEKESETKMVATSIATAFFYPLFLLGLGAIVRMFMPTAG